MRARDLPNLLCVLRIALALPAGWLIVEGRYRAALAVIFVAGFTDGLDGFLAKRYAWQSELGGILDPLADKLLITTGFVCLWAVGAAPGWLLVAVVVRDIVIVTGATVYRVLFGPFEAAPTRISRLNSGAQMLFVLVTLVHLSTGVPNAGVLVALAWAVLATTVVSGLDYVVTWSLRARTAGH